MKNSNELADILLAPYGATMKSKVINSAVQPSGGPNGVIRECLDRVSQAYGDDPIQLRQEMRDDEAVYLQELTRLAAVDVLERACDVSKPLTLVEIAAVLWPHIKKARNS